MTVLRAVGVSQNLWLFPRRPLSCEPVRATADLLVSRWQPSMVSLALHCRIHFPELFQPPSKRPVTILWRSVS